MHPLGVEWEIREPLLLFINVTIVRWKLTKRVEKVPSPGPRHPPTPPVCSSASFLWCFELVGGGGTMERGGGRSAPQGKKKGHRVCVPGQDTAQLSKAGRHTEALPGCSSGVVYLGSFQDHGFQETIIKGRQRGSR